MNTELHGEKVVVSPVRKALLTTVAIGLAILARISLSGLAENSRFMVFIPAVLLVALYARWQWAVTTTVICGGLGEYFMIRSAGVRLSAAALTPLLLFLGASALVILFIEALQRARDRARWLAREAEQQRRLTAEINARLEQRVAERTAELEAAHSALRSVMDGAPDPMAAMDMNMRLTAFNRAYANEFQARFGRAPELGASLAQLLAGMPEEQTKLLKLWQAAARGQMESEEAFGEPERGRRFYQFRSSFLRDKHGNPTELVYSARDITEYRELQEKLRRMNEALEQQVNERTMALSSALEALRENQERLRQQASQLEKTVAARTAKLTDTVTELESFAYTVAHDLRAPLRAITSMAVLLEEELGEGCSQDAHDYMDRIRRAAGRMDALIRDLLMLSRVGRAEVVPCRVNLDALVVPLVTENPELQPAHAEVSVHYPLGVVLGNDMLLTQAVSNLLGNAVKFVPKGKRPRVVVRTEQNDGRVRLWIEDNGVGIEEQFHAKIFGIFERLDTKFEGTGIGLAIVRRAVERLDGSVGVESTLGQGSRFWIELPATD